MTKTTMRSLRLLPLVCAALVLLAQPGLGQKLPRRHEEATPPIQLGDITVEYLTQNEAGQYVWQSPKHDNLNVIEIPAGAQRLRLTAGVLNRGNGSSIRFRAALQEVCGSGKSGKPYVTMLRHLTESDPTGYQTGETTDDELRVVADGKVSIELPVHCEDCVRASCGRECEGRDHLGEGPHVVIVTTSDPSPTDPQNGPVSRVASFQQSPSTAAPARPSSYRLDVMTSCPKSGAGKSRSIKSRAVKPRAKKRSR